MTDIKRPHYFKGQFLTADDFIAEQKYHIEMRRLHNSTMHIWGVIEGLVVTADGTGVKVSAGMAIDKEGREIRLLKQTSLPIPQPTADGQYLVVISYKEEFDKESPYPPASPSDPEESRYIRKVETGELSWGASTTSNEGNLLHLAHVNINGGRVAGQLTTVKRRNASSRIPRGSILGDNDLTITPDGKIGIGTIQPASKLSVFGTQPDQTDKEGIRAINVLTVFGGKGGNTSGSGQTAGAGASIDLRAGSGGDALAGNGGHGGSIILSPGKAGAGSLGKAGSVRLAPDGGNVGVGVTDPKSALEVKGEVIIRGALKFSDEAGNVYANNWIGMANNVDPDRPTKWLHIGGISDEGARRLAFMADRTYMSGNVGIGTTAPGAKLEINGDLLLKHTHGQLGLWDTNAAANKGRFYFWNAGGGVYGRWVKDDNSATVVADNIFFKNDGKVGIGTIDPGFTLQVGNHLQVSEARLCIAGRGETGYWRRWTLRTGDKDNATGAATAAEIHKLRIRDENANADRLVIDEEGRIGIGTTSPNSDLVICKNVMNALGPVLTFLNNGGGADAGGAIDFKVNDYTGKSDTTARIRSISDGIYSSHLAFYTKEYSTEASKPLKEVMRLQSDGKVGIGTSRPGARLDVGDLSINTMKSILARMDEGNNNGVGTCLGVKAYNTQGTGAIKSFAIEHYFYGQLNGWIGFYRGGGTNDGYLMLSPGWRVPASDLAELFETAEPIVPGDVVVFDEQKEVVRLCESEADGCVIGIASSEPAGVLGKAEGNATPIALCGRVPCNVDADIAPIRSGDLLTTSPTRGHAQKVLDEKMAVGAIIGKALGSLEKGKGKITVLVALA